MKTLIYIGLNHGDSFLSLVPYFDKIIGFEPINELFQKVKSKAEEMYKNKTFYFYNCAVSNYNGQSSFFISSNKCASSSLSKWSNETAKKVYPHIEETKEIKVEVKKLDEILKELKIDYVDYLVTDAQGSDYSILLSVKNLINSKKIEFIQTENYIKHIYNDLPNSFWDTKKLLEENYELQFLKCENDTFGIDNVYKYTEFDSFWKIKS